MEIEPTPIAGASILRPTVHGDARGFFLETWHADRYAEAGIDQPFVQDNHSRSHAGFCVDCISKRRSHKESWSG